MAAGRCRLPRLPREEWWRKKEKVQEQQQEEEQGQKKGQGQAQKQSHSASREGIGTDLLARRSLCP